MSKKTASWSRLDNAAKIFPPTSTEKDTKVFRFACELYEEVRPDRLQAALDTTLAYFPGFRSVLKRGLFWYYLEGSDLAAQVKEEDAPPCGVLYDRNVKTLLFEVTYYGRRINVEVYHALADGNGALEFLKTLVYHYLLLAHPEAFPQPPVMDYDASDRQRMDDSFARYYSAQKTAKRPTVKAYRLRGARLPEHRLRIIEGVTPTAALLACARERGVTLTVLLAALLIFSIRGEMTVRDCKRPVVLAVPVNLRKYFHSESARNFFSVIQVGYDFAAYSGEFEDVLARLKAAFQEELTEEQLQSRMDAYSALEYNVFARATPLILKDLFMRIAHDLSEKETTVSLSNLGRIAMPPEMRSYIRLFDVFNSTPRLQLCLCSYEEHTTLTFSSTFVSTDVQRRFFRALSALGLPVEVTASPVGEEEEA